MRRRLSLVIAFIGVLGLIGFAPSADADHYTGAPGKVRNDTTHDARPTPPTPLVVENVCSVFGLVRMNVGIDGTPRHNHYRFVDTAISCFGLNANYNRSFSVHAAGGTDGPGNPVMGGHGEDDLQGWSHKSCYVGYNDPGCHEGKVNKKLDPVDDLYDGTNRNGNGNDCWNCGEIRVESLDPVTGAPDGEKLSGFPEGGTSDNFVMFDRVGSLVTVWGALTNWQGTDSAFKNAGGALCFLAELEFMQENPPPGEDVKPIDRAILSGVGTTWTTMNKDDCGLEQAVNKKPGT